MNLALKRQNIYVFSMIQDLSIHYTRLFKEST